MAEMIVFSIVLGIFILVACGVAGYITYLQERVKRSEAEKEIYRKELNYQRVITEVAVKYRDFIT